MKKCVIALILLGAMIAPASAKDPCGQVTCGKVSFYGGPYEYYYSATASGEKFYYKNLTAASRTLKFGTKLKVTYKGKSVVVKVNDRGPYVGGRKLDISYGAAKAIGMIRAGVATICYEVVG